MYPGTRINEINDGRIHAKRIEGKHSDFIIVDEVINTAEVEPVEFEDLGLNKEYGFTIAPKYKTWKKKKGKIVKTSNWDKNIVYDSDCWIVFEDRPQTNCSGDCWNGMTVAEIEAKEGKKVLEIYKLVCTEKTIYKKPRLEKENKKAKVVCC